MIHRRVVLVLMLTACAAREPGAEPVISSSAPPGISSAEWVFDDEATAFARARAEHKRVAIEFWASWDPSCAAFESALQAEPVRTELARGFVVLKLDVSEFNEVNGERQARYQGTTFRLPDLVFVFADGRVIRHVDQVVHTAVLVAEIRAAAGRR